MIIIAVTLYFLYSSAAVDMTPSGIKSNMGLGLRAMCLLFGRRWYQLLLSCHLSARKILAQYEPDKYNLTLNHDKVCLKVVQSKMKICVLQIISLSAAFLGDYHFNLSRIIYSDRQICSSFNINTIHMNETTLQCTVCQHLQHLQPGFFSRHFKVSEQLDFAFPQKWLYNYKVRCHNVMA